MKEQYIYILEERHLFFKSLSNLKKFLRNHYDGIMWTTRDIERMKHLFNNTSSTLELLEFYYFDIEGLKNKKVLTIKKEVIL